MTGQLTLYADDGKQFRIAFERGAVIGATSPMSSDSAARIALTNHLITSSQVAQIARSVAAHPEADELDILSAACKLDSDRALRLRQRVVAQRAARTFAVEHGTFVVTDTVTIPAVRDAAVDIRAVVYLGVRMNLSEQRLVSDLRGLGSHFVLRSEAESELAQFGLTTTEAPILEALRAGATLPELEARHRDVDPRSMQSVVYALVSCFACEASQRHGDLDESTQEYTPVAQAASSAIDGVFIKRSSRVHADPTPPESWGAVGTPTRTTTRSTTIPAANRPGTIPPDRADDIASAIAAMLPRTDTPRSTRVFEDPTPRIEPRTKTPGDPSASRPVFMSRTMSQNATTPPALGRTPSPLPLAAPRTTTTLPPATGRSPSQPVTGRTPSSPPSPTVARSISQSTPSLSTPSLTAPPPPTTAARTTSSSGQHPVVARVATPLAPPSIGDGHTPTSSASATNLEAFTSEDPSSARIVDPLAAAAEAYQRGQSALRDDHITEAIVELTRAADLNPHNFDYHAMLAWAQFCGAEDRSRIADKVRKMLSYAIQKSTNPELARFYLGRMERMLGRDREALYHFQRVLDAQPRNTDVQSEIRQLEARIASGSGEKAGLASLFKRKDKDKGP